MKRFKKLAVYTLAGLFLIGLPFAAFAATSQMSQSIYVGPDEIISGNFIKAGNVIDIQGAVNGDVILAGNSITISGPVAGDVIAAGNNIRISGKVSGSIRVVGNSIQVDTEVSHNVWAAGNTFVLGKDGKVGWDVYSAGASIQLNGPVAGNVWAAGANLIIGNEIGKDVNASIDKEGQITLYPSAKIDGNLTYKAAKDEQLVLKDGAKVIGQTSRKAIIVPAQTDWKRFFGPAYFFFKLISLFGLLVVGLVLVTLVPKMLLEIKEEMVKKVWPSVGWGFVYLVVIPVLVIILAITIIGLPLALMLVPLYVVGLYISTVIAGFTIGLLLLNKLNKDQYKGSLIWPLVLGLVVLVILSSIPLIGWLVKLFLVLWALGAAISVKKQVLKEYR